LIQREIERARLERIEAVGRRGVGSEHAQAPAATRSESASRPVTSERRVERAPERPRPVGPKSHH
jgi:hypothetical protein